MKHKIDIVGKLKLQSIEIVQVPKDISMQNGFL
jgi:hypothetical protein